MRILVTGAAGFVGTHLVEELSGHEVLTTEDSRRRDGFPRLSDEHLQVNLAEPWAPTEVVQSLQPDYVVHLAARYGRILCRDEPQLAVQDNTAATTELAAACAERAIPVLYASSSEVYGDHGTNRITEQTELRMPTTIYGLSKRWGEEALRLYLPPEKLCIVRMNMLYGPEQLGGYGRCALATFIKNAAEGKPITVHRHASRSWLYISDAVRALRMLIEGAYSGVWNLGNQHEFESLGATALRVTDKIEVTDAPPGQIRHKNFSSDKIEAALDWAPEVTLEDGIRRTLEWASERHGAASELAA